MPLCSTEHTQVYFVLRKQCLWAAIVHLDTLFSFLCTLGYVCYILYSIDYNLEAAESNNLLVDLLESHDDAEVDQANSAKRSNGRHHSLFGLYPLLDRGEAKETRSPVSPPAEHKGLRLLVKVSELRYNSCVDYEYRAVLHYNYI